MTRVIILYAPDDGAIRKFAEHVQKAFDKKSFTVSVKAAEKANIADIAAVQGVILGCRGNNAVSIEEGFHELLHSFSGVNFAGRTAGIFMERETATFIDFSAALSDSEILIFDEPLQLSPKDIDIKQLTRWVKKYSAFIKENENE